MSARFATTGISHACIAPFPWGVLFVLPEWANTRLDGYSGPARSAQASGRHRRRR